jgi:uncharacterized repeat protein (TIGR03803 family)
MTNTGQHRGWIAKITSGATRNALALVATLSFVVFGASAHAQSTLLYTFTGGTDGGRPNSRVISDAQGNFLGTTYWGGDLTCNGGNGCGVVYRLTPTGMETVVYSFAGGTDGAYPTAALIMDAQGNSYGVTTGGGGTGCFGVGCGTVFKIDTTGEEMVLYRFTGGTDGGGPSSALVLDATGRLVGTTSSGGNLNCNAPYGCGVVYAYDRVANKEIVLMTMSGGVSGAYPSVDSLAHDTKGNFYGTARGGGDPNCNCGVAFKLDPAGTETVLHAFLGVTDGSYPDTGLILDNSPVSAVRMGTLSGTTAAGGAYGKGTLFQITSNGYSKVYDFGSGMDGVTPFGALNICADGSVLGGTETGGTLGYGMLYKVDNSGKETDFHDFNYSVDGAVPLGALMWKLVPGEEPYLVEAASEGGSFPLGVGSGTVIETTLDNDLRCVGPH